MTSFFVKLKPPLKISRSATEPPIDIDIKPGNLITINCCLVSGPGQIQMRMWADGFSHCTCVIKISIILLHIHHHNIL